MAESSSMDSSVLGGGAPTTSVVLEPSDSLSFHLQQQTSPQAVLTIRNVSDSKKIAFKVKTTRPLRYLVRPNQGMLGPNGSASIVVILQQKDCDELLRLDPSERQLSNDKFLVQSIYVDDSFFESAKTKSSKEMADELTTMWTTTDKKNLSNKKLRCRFLLAEEHSSNSSNTLPNESVSRSSSIYTPESEKSSSTIIDATAASNSSSEIKTSGQLSSALLQEDATTKSKTSSSFSETISSSSAPSSSSGPSSSVQEVAALRKKYDELVAFTVQLTAQRDVLMSDLEKTRQSLQKANADAQRVKKAESDNTTGLRQRKGTAGSGSTTGSSADDNTKFQKEAEHFTLFHLLICAIIFFLVGRYY